MNTRVYTYKNCDTCRKAVKWLEERGIDFVEIPIREQPPTKKELEQMLSFYAGDVRRLFNTAGQDYKAMNLKQKLSGMSAADAVQLLSGNGNLVKRPFVLREGRGLVGFKGEEWERFFCARS
jgi:arsenate reductase (glutaredoxin)